jgi:microcystin-dependent protein
MESYIGEIRMFAGDYAPQGWLPCDGSLQSISAYQTLYSLIGTTYGGNGTTTFGLPDLRGRIPVGQGQGQALSPRTIGQMSGTETVALAVSELPSHSHIVNGTASPATTVTPGNTVTLAAATAPAANYLVSLPSPRVERVLDNHTIGNTGGNATGGANPHDNVMPSFAVTFIICTNGIYPQKQ